MRAIRIQDCWTQFAIIEHGSAIIEHGSAIRVEIMPRASSIGYVNQYLEPLAIAVTSKIDAAFVQTRREIDDPPAKPRASARKGTLAVGNSMS